MGFFERKKVVSDDNELVKEVKRLEEQIEALKRSKMSLTEQYEELKFKKRLEQEEIIHLQKINEERLKQEVENEKIKLSRKYSDDIGKFKEEQRRELVESLKEFHNKIENRFSTELKNLKEVYALLMSHLPNVNLEITKHVGDAKYIEAAPQRNKS